MLKFLLIFIAVILVIRWVFRRSLRNLQQNLQNMQDRAGGAEPGAQVLSSCPNCGTYFSDDKGVTRGSSVFCSESCSNHHKG